MNTQTATQDQILKTAYNKMMSFASKQSTSTLQETAKMLMDNTEEGSGIAFNAVLDVLETRMEEAAFIEFCDNL